METAKFKRKIIIAFLRRLQTACDMANVRTITAALSKVIPDDLSPFLQVALTRHPRAKLRFMYLSSFTQKC